MNDTLAEILASKRQEVEHAQRERPLDVLQARAIYRLPCRNFYGAVSLPRRDRPNLIAEIKRSSPSAGLIRADFDPLEIARQYEAAGADALSVLTDETFFGGHPTLIERTKAVVGLPILRKDFIIDAYQVHESRALGADAILLIAEALTSTQIVDFAHLGRALGLAVLLEVHDEARFSDVLAVLPDLPRTGLLLGLNNRDLRRQQTDTATTERLAERVPIGLPIVSESGIRTRRDVQRLFSAGARALLIGETLLRAADPGEKIHELFA